MKICFSVVAQFATREGLRPARVETQAWYDDDELSPVQIISLREHARTLADDAVRDYLATISADTPTAVERIEEP